MGLPELFKRCPCGAPGRKDRLTLSGIGVVAADGVFAPLLFHLQQKARRVIIFPDTSVYVLSPHFPQRKDKGMPLLPASSSPYPPTRPVFVKGGPGELRQAKVCPVV